MIVKVVAKFFWYRRKTFCLEGELLNMTTRSGLD